MAQGFNEEIKNIYRLSVPFEKIYTSVFLIISDDKRILVDCATTRDDVDQHIVPALEEFGHTLSELSAIVLTHRHGDHAGGLERVLQLAPDIKVITEVCTLTDKISTYALAGHTSDSIGILDERTHTLISGDGIQGAGVDKYRCNIKDASAYLKTLQKIGSDKRIENILFSHAYEPWNSDRIFGRENLCSCLIESEKYIKR